MEFTEKKFRHEHKYVSPEHILSAQQFKISSLLDFDSHTGADGQYEVRSIYFDDIYNSCYRENENGTDPREKFRIRVYNRSDKKISLELKQKEKGLCRKTSCPMPLGTCREIMEGKIPDFGPETPFLIKKLIMQMNMRALKPVVIVAYERVPFVYRDGNVRITFDRNIRSSDRIGSFFDRDCPFRPVLGIGTNMMEVKFDAFLPDFINESLQTGRLRQTAFSKYYLCRKYNMEGLI